MLKEAFREKVTVDPDKGWSNLLLAIYRRYLLI